MTTLALPHSRPSYARGYAKNALVAEHGNLLAGLVAGYEPGFGVTGDKVHDVSGKGNTGTWNGNGEHWTVSEGRYAAQFNGSDDYVDCGNISSTLFAADFCIGVWVNHAVAATEFILGKGTATNVNIDLLTRSSGATTRYEFRIDQTTGADVATAYVVRTSLWEHVVVNRGGNDLRIFVNGVSAGSAVNTNDGSTTGSWFIGDTSSNPGIIEWNGLIDSILIYNRALSATEVKQLYQLGRGGVFQKKSSYLSVSGVEPSTSTVISLPAKKPSFVNGYARNPAQAKKPNLLTGLVGAYEPGFGVTGEKVHDVSGKGNTGTWAGTGEHWAVSEGRYAAQFNGADDIVEVGNPPEIMGLGPTYDFTIAMWAFPRAYEVGIAVGLGTSAQNQITIIPNDAATSGIRIRTSGTNILMDGGGDRTGTWMHIAFVCRANDDWELFFQGVSVDTYTSADTLTIADELNIGAGNVSAAHFDGLLDDILIYNRALSASEISKLYQLGRGGAFQKKSSYLSVSGVEPSTSTVISLPAKKPSFVSGYARNPAQAKKPNLLTGLVAGYEPGFGVTGDKLHDVSGKGNTGTWNGTGPEHWAVSKGRYAAQFNGVNDYVGFGDADWYDDVLTYALWYYLDSGGHFYQRLVCKGLGTNTEIFIRTNSELEIRINGADRITGLPAVLRTWTHVVFTRITGVGTYAYINGDLAGSGASVNPTSNDSTLEFGGALAERPFSGMLDDVIFYNRALSASEISQLYQLGRGGVFQLKDSHFAIGTAEEADVPYYMWARQHNSQVIGGGV